METQKSKKGRKLSKREAQVLLCLKDGLKNKGISITLDISEKTVSTYILRLRAKLDVKQHQNVYILVTEAIKQNYINN